MFSLSQHLYTAGSAGTARTARTARTPARGKRGQPVSDRVSESDPRTRKPLALDRIRGTVGPTGRTGLTGLTGLNGLSLCHCLLRAYALLSSDVNALLCLIAGARHELDLSQTCHDPSPLLSHPHLYCPSPSLQSASTLNSSLLSLTVRSSHCQCNRRELAGPLSGSRFALLFGQCNICNHARCHEDQRSRDPRITRS